MDADLYTSMLGCSKTSILTVYFTTEGKKKSHFPQLPSGATGIRSYKFLALRVLGGNF